MANDAGESELVKQAVRDVFNEKAVTYAHGATEFANEATDAIAKFIDAWDNFMLRNLAEDTPEAAKSVIDARIASIERSKAIMEEKAESLRELSRRIG